MDQRGTEIKTSSEKEKEEERRAVHYRNERKQETESVTDRQTAGLGTTGKANGNFDPILSRSNSSRKSVERWKGTARQNILLLWSSCLNLVCQR